MDNFNTLLLFVILVVIIIYFTWNYLSNKKIDYRLWERKNDDIRYHELKSKYEFLVAIVTFIIAVAVFYGYSTKKEIEESIKKDFDSKLEVEHKKLTEVNKKLKNLDSNVSNRIKSTSTTIDAYFNSLKQIESRQNTINELSDKSQGKLKEFERKIVNLNDDNTLKRNFYLVDNIKIKYDEYSMINEHYISYSYKNLTTTLGDKLPNFETPPIIIAVSNNGFGIQIFDVTLNSFKVRIVPEYADVPKDGIIVVKLLISETK